jgi:hypothetical protein
MTDRKATFAKRQREMEQKDRAKQREARRAERRASPGGGGPVIDWASAQTGQATTTDDPENPEGQTFIEPTPDRSSDQADAPASDASRPARGRS